MISKCNIYSFHLPYQDNLRDESNALRGHARIVGQTLILLVSVSRSYRQGEYIWLFTPPPRECSSVYHKPNDSCINNQVLSRVRSNKSTAPLVCDRIVGETWSLQAQVFSIPPPRWQKVKWIFPSTMHNIAGFPSLLTSTIGAIH